MWFWLQLAAVFSWSLINVLDSMLVRRFTKDPFVLMWAQSCFSVPILWLLLLLVFDIPAGWVVIFLIVGLLGYVGDLLFLVILDRVDVSVSNVAWMILSVFLSLVGFWFFGETWSVSQTIGVTLVFTGVFMLSLWHRRLGGFTSFLLLALLAVLYMPFYSVQKAALLAGQGALAVSFWPILSRETSAFLFPLLYPSLRRRILTFLPRSTRGFHVANGLVIALFLSATVLATLAFAFAPLSIVAVVGNIQPFVVLLLGGVFATFLPSLAPRELFTKQVLQVKIASFAVAFIGLALLARSS